MHVNYTWHSQVVGLGSSKLIAEQCTIHRTAGPGLEVFGCLKTRWWSNAEMTCYACRMKKSQVNGTVTVQLPHKVWMRVTKSHRPSRNYSVLMVAKEKKSLRTQQQLHRSNSPLQRDGELDLTAKRYICVYLNREITSPENSCLT